MRLEGKVALVTGGNRGIGRAIVHRFTAEGAKVSFCARREEIGRKVEEDVRASGGDATFICADLTDEDQVRGVIDQTVSRYGKLDIVVNSAGVAPAGMVETMELSEWEDTIRINVSTMFLVSKHAIPHLRKTAPGSNIINLGSTFGTVGAAGSSVYAVTKAAAINFSKTLALELIGDGIRVNALCPGGTDTEFLNEWFEATGDAEGTRTWLVDHHPIGRLSTPEEQANAALFLASDEASFVTGSTMLVDGGYTAQ
jgi:NAD(P)-dependent dehydrogenase (short-subunit alcohol dehydrogenase family)